MLKPTVKPEQQYRDGDEDSPPDPSDSGIWRQKTKWTASESIVDLLCDVGVDTFFGLPGGPIIPMFDAILTHSRATLVEPRHETYGAFEAMGFFRASGRVPALVVTAGPGATNAVTGIVAASFERVPMIVICGDVPWATTGRRLTQQTGGDGGIGIDRMLTGVARAVVRVARGESARGQVLGAIRAATDPSNPGPVLVVLPVDRGGSSVQFTSLYGTPGLPPRATQPIDRSLLDRVLIALANARRPLVVVGAGCRGSERAVTAMIDALGVPFATTAQAKGLVSEEHPLSLRALGMGASWWTRRYTRAGVDVSIVLGTDLDDSATAGTPVVGPKGLLVHVDTDPSVFGRNFETAIGASYDVASFADQLAESARKYWGAPHPRGAAIARAAREESPFDCPTFATDEAHPIAPHRAVADLEQAAGADAIFTSDIGEHMLFALHYLTARGPDRFALHLGLGSMGSGIGSAIGHALGAPDRRVVCICGDGGMEMAGAEILVAVKHRLPIVFAVFNDARYNMVYHGYRFTFGREAAFDTPVVDFAKWAESLGAVGARIDGPGEITREKLDAWTAAGLPVVLDIRIDASIRIKGDGRIEAIRQMSLLHGDEAASLAGEEKTR